MALIQQCCLLLSVYALQFAYCVNNFPESSQLMDLYSRDGLLSTIQLKAFRDFEIDWQKTSAQTRLSKATVKNLNSFFYKIDVANDNYHRAMDSLVAPCSLAKAVLPRLTTRKDLSATNKVVNNFVKAFSESRTHLYDVKFALVEAVEFLGGVDAKHEMSTSGKRFIITDFENGTVQLDAEGDLYDRTETLPNLLLKLSHYTLTARKPVVTLYNYYTGASTIRDSSQQVAVPSAFFARVENVKNQVTNIIRKVDDVIGKVTQVDDIRENDEFPTDQDIETLTRQCENYHPV